MVARRKALGEAKVGSHKCAVCTKSPFTVSLGSLRRERRGGRAITGARRGPRAQAMWWKEEATHRRTSLSMSPAHATHVGSRKPAKRSLKETGGREDEGPPLSPPPESE